MASLRKNEDELELPFDFDNLFVTSQVQVVQAVDVKAIKVALRYVIDKIHGKDKKSEGPKSPAEVLADLSDRDNLRKAVEQLMKDKEEMSKEMTELKERVMAAENELNNLNDTKASKDQIPEGLSGLQLSVTGLEERVIVLEAQPGTARDVDDADKVEGEDGEGSDGNAGDVKAKGDGEEESGGEGEAAAAVPLDLDSLAAQYVEDSSAAPCQAAEQAVALPVADVGPPPTAIVVNEDGSVDTSVLAEALNKALAQLTSVTSAKADISMLDEVRSAIGMAPVAPSPGLQDQTGQAMGDVQDGQQAMLGGGLAGQPGIAGLGGFGAAGGRLVGGDMTLTVGGGGIGGVGAVDTAEALNKLRLRLDALEVALAMRPTAAAVDRPSLDESKEAVDKVKSLEDLLPLIKDIYTSLESKAEGEAVQGLSTKLLEVMESVSEKPEKAWVQQMLKQLFSSGAMGGGKGEDGAGSVDFDSMFTEMDAKVSSELAPLMAEVGGTLFR
eukprot:gene440-1838_t